MTIRAVQVDSIFQSAPGSIKFFGEVDRPDVVAGFNFSCPCGCGHLGGVNLRPGGWTWNGDKEKPTVQPSIYFNQGGEGEWHGYLTDGEWRVC